MRKLPGPSPAAQHVTRLFRWIDGEADTWAMFHEAESLTAIVGELAALLRQDRIDLVIGIEARGFVIAPAVAISLGVGFAPVRKGGALFPGNTISEKTDLDYRGNSHSLSARADHFHKGARVALVDDWIETGSQATAAARLVSQAGAELISLAVIIDEAADSARAALPPIRSVLRKSDLA